MLEEPFASKRIKHHDLEMPYSSEIIVEIQRLTKFIPVINKLVQVATKTPSVITTTRYIEKINI